MENNDYTVQNVSPMTFNDEMKAYLMETAKWGKFLAIMGYIGIGIIALLGLFIMLGFSAFSEYTQIPFPMGALGIIYILFAVLYYFPVYYLHKFSNRSKQALLMNDQTSLTSSFSNLKSLFRFLGIATIVILSLYALIVVIAVPVALLAS